MNYQPRRKLQNRLGIRICLLQCNYQTKWVSIGMLQSPILGCSHMILSAMAVFSNLPRESLGLSCNPDPVCLIEKGVLLTEKYISFEIFHIEPTGANRKSIHFSRNGIFNCLTCCPTCRQLFIIVKHWSRTSSLVNFQPHSRVCDIA